MPDDVRYIHASGNPEIGVKRNLGCEHARGDLIAHWDDDDYSAPGRLADQVQRLADGRAAVTGYRSMRFTDGHKWRLYFGAPDYAVGTSLMYRRDWWQHNRFPCTQVGEDNDFVARARAQRVIVSADAGELMYATVHPGNTSPRSWDRGNWREIVCPSS